MYIFAPLLFTHNFKILFVLHFSTIFYISNKFSFAHLWNLQIVLSLLTHTVCSIENKLTDPKIVEFVIDFFVPEFIYGFRNKALVETLKTAEAIIIDKVIKYLLLTKVAKRLPIIEIIMFEMAIYQILANCHLIQKLFLFHNAFFNGLPY